MNSRSIRGATGLTVAVVVGAILIIGLIIIMSTGGDGGTGNNATSTPTGNNNPPAASQPSDPDVTTSPNAIASDTTVSLTGTVVPNGSFTTYWYEYGRTTNFSNTTAKQSIGSSYNTIAAPAFITGLTANITYNYRLVAENGYGKTNGSTHSFKTTQGTPAPTATAPTVKTVAATDIARTNATLRGEVTPNRADTSYWFEYGRTQNLGNATSFKSAGNGTTKITPSVEVSDLAPATTYYFQLNAQNQFGTVNGAILSFKTAGPQEATDPLATTNNVTNITSSTVTFNGMVNPGGAATDYWFEYSTDSLLGSVLRSSTPEKQLGATFADTNVFADLTGLSSNTTYFVRLVAENAEGLDRGNRVSFTTK